MLENILDKETFDYKNNKFFNLLLEKKIFIDEDLDEELVVRGIYEEHIIRSNTLDIMLIVTQQCNFRCVYCGQPHLNKQMDDSNYQSVLNFIKNQLVKHSYKKVRVTFFGGEPLLESDKICEFLENLKKLLSKISCRDNEITYEAGMSTNGYLLTPKLFERLSDLNCKFYQISVDGMPETHNQMRPLVSGEPTWSRIIGNLSYMITTDKNFNVTLRTNFNADVADSLVEFYKYINKNLNDNRINIYYETIKNQGNEKTPNTVCGIEELVFDVDIASIIKENHLICSNTTSRLLPCSWVCYASMPNYFIFKDDGNIIKCSFALESSKNIIGKLDPDGLFDTNFQNYYNWVYNDYLTSKQCKMCKALPLCFGKRCPKSKVEFGEMRCNIDAISAEIEGLLNSYY